MKDVDSQIRSAQLNYRMHGDMNRYWPVVVERLTFLFQATDYDLDYIDWVETNADDLRSRIRGVGRPTPLLDCFGPARQIARGRSTPSILTDLTFFAFHCRDHRSGAVDCSVY